MTINLTGYTLTYDDEFNSFTSSPDGSSGYQTTFYFGGRELYSNGDLEYYSDSTVGVNPFTLNNGALQITASPGTNPDNQPYNSGQITTEGNFSQTYGYFEARVEVAQGAGMWSGFWMLQADKNWPPEIDAMEAFGKTNPGGDGGSTLVSQGNHAPDANDNLGGWHTVNGNIWTSYHTYGVDWEPDTITFYVDGNAVQQIATPADENSPMYMLLDLAVGGWPGNPAGETSVMSIDYLRAYSKNPNATAVALQTISSPDGVDTTPNGATDAHGLIGGTDQIVVRVSEDAYQGDAQFTVMVDGVQVGGVMTATASHTAGQWQNLTLNTDLSAGNHVIAVNYINDVNGGTATTDRNLYVQSVSVDGEVLPGVSAQSNTAAAGHTTSGAAVMEVNGTASFNAVYSTLDLKVSEDAWNGNANFIVTVDGIQVGGIQSVTASHAANQWQDVILNGYFSDGPHAVDVQFINDAWGGTSATDRNMYVQSVNLNGEVIAGSAAVSNTAANGQQATDPHSAVLAVNGTAEFDTKGTATPAQSTLVLHVSEDAWNGNAQFTVSVDGVQVGGIQTATAIHAQHQIQDITLTGNFGFSGPGKIDITFLNDGWGGSAATDRNLYINSLDINGVHFAGNAYATDTAANGTQSSDPTAAVMAINGTTEYNINHTAPPTSSSGSGSTGTGTTPPANNPSTLVLHVAEDAWNGNAQFAVSIDGVAVGNVQTVTAIHGQGQVQDITLTGDFGSLGPDHIDISFLNDGWGGSAATDRNLYIESLDINGVHFAGNTAANNAANGEQSLDPTAAVMAINGTAEFDIHHTAPPPPPDLS
jgi:beta-glucanase (GH16 family)